MLGCRRGRRRRSGALAATSDDARRRCRQHRPSGGPLAERAHQGPQPADRAHRPRATTGRALVVRRAAARANREKPGKDMSGVTYYEGVHESMWFETGGIDVTESHI